MTDPTPDTSRAPEQFADLDREAREQMAHFDRRRPSSVIDLAAYRRERWLSEHTTPMPEPPNDAA